MNIVDVGIVILLLFGALLGFKRGFTTSIVKAVGFILVIILAYLFKDPVSVFLYEHLPFFNFGFLKGAAILNILLYELLAFILMVIILSIALKILLMVTSVFEKLLNATIILGIPSKIAGAIVGFIHDYIIVFFILYAITIFGINVSLINDSNLRDKIVNHTPILSKIFDQSVKVFNEFKDLKKDYDNKSISENDFNYKSMDLFLKYNVIEPKSALKLIEADKLDSFDYYQDLINKYKEA